MTGSTNYVVRDGYNECSVWRKALGNDARLLAMAATGECLDAPEWIPSGSTTQHISGCIVSRSAFNGGN